MNPLPLALLALRRSWRSAVATALLVALATALGTGIGVLERGMRRSAARSADAFDLVVGAPGGAAQLVLTAVFLRPDTVPLLDPAVAARVLAEDVAWSSPIGFGDSYRGSPVVGVAPAFVTRGGARAPAEGRVFATENEAVLGSAVPLRLGERFSPVHGLVEAPGARAHVHEEVAYEAVGRLSATGTPWDNAVLVPIESVWELHGLGNGHPDGVERVGPPWENAAGLPAIVLKPRSFAAAYQLRARYRAAGSTAVFPGEVLAELFRLGGDVRALLTAVATATATLVIAAVFLAFTAALGGRARELAVLRALGAPRAFLLLALWIEFGILLVAGTVVGVLLGWAGAAIAAGALGRAAGAAISVVPGAAELGLAAAILGVGLLAALLPALLGTRDAPGAVLKR